MLIPPMEQQALCAQSTQRMYTEHNSVGKAMAGGNSGFILGHQNNYSTVPVGPLRLTIFTFLPGQ